MSINTTIDDNKVTIQLNGAFDFNYYKEFRNAYKNIPDPAKKSFIVDFTQVSYIDSSALGMLLMLKEHIGGDRSRVILKNPVQDVLNILKISNFDKLMMMTS